MDLRTAVVTGATSGLGLAVSRVLAGTPGWRVVLAVRDVERGRAVARDLGPHAAVVPLDLASLASVRTAAAQVTEEHAPVAALVLNAGVQTPRADQVSADGYELTFAVNHLGHALLAELVQPSFAPDARLVVVSSGTHFGSLRKAGPYPGPRWADPEELARPSGRSGQRAYSTSKLANVYFGYEAARRWPGTAVTVFDPGLMPTTGLARAYPAPARAAYAVLAPLLARLPQAQPPEQAAAQLARVVTDPPEPGRARYLELGREVPSSPESYDEDRARELWEATRRLVAQADRRAVGT